MAFLAYLPAERVSVCLASIKVRREGGRAPALWRVYVQGRSGTALDWKELGFLGVPCPGFPGAGGGYLGGSSLVCV